MDRELLYQIALTLIPGIGPVQARILLQHFEPPEIFCASRSSLERIEGIGSARAAAIRDFDDYANAEDEIRFIEKYQVMPLFISDPRYPQRLLHCCDSPILLFYKGSADLNASRIIAVIGTRSNTEYGKMLAEKLIAGLAELNVLIVSGLAHGIDAIAHRSALQNDLATVGVLAHGLDQVYPQQHTALAKDMIREKGGLLTEFRSKTMPDRHNFPSRNRIVAGMSDATIVVETGIKGGSMITADLANGYNKDVFAFPGKVTDNKSGGCNHLIKNNKAMLLTDAEQLIELLNWKDTSTRDKIRKQRELFIELTHDEKLIVDILKEKESTHIDEINIRSGLSSSAIAAAILSLELQNVIIARPGKLYMLQ